MRENEARVREILAKVKPLAVEYYRLTGKPLGVTGEVAEYVAAEILGLTLVPVRTVGCDALRGKERDTDKRACLRCKSQAGTAHVPHQTRCTLRHCVARALGQRNARST